MDFKHILDKKHMFYTDINGKPCSEGKRIGYCWSKCHKGYVTKAILDEHKCIEKNCDAFQKYEDAQYWKDKEKQRQKRKEHKNNKKEIKAKEEYILSLFREATKDFEDFAITSVNKEGNVYKVNFVKLNYVSLSGIVDDVRRKSGVGRIYLHEIKTDNTRKRMLIEKHRTNTIE